MSSLPEASPFVKEWRPSDWSNWNDAWLKSGKPEDGSEGCFERGADQMYRAIKEELSRKGYNLPEVLTYEFI